MQLLSVRDQLIRFCQNKGHACRLLAARAIALHAWMDTPSYPGVKVRDWLLGAGRGYESRGAGWRGARLYAAYCNGPL